KRVALPAMLELSMVKLPLAVTIPTAGAAAMPNDKFATRINAISDCTENRCTFFSPKKQTFRDQTQPRVAKTTTPVFHRSLNADLHKSLQRSYRRTYAIG